MYFVCDVYTVSDHESVSQPKKTTGHARAVHCCACCHGWLQRHNGHCAQRASAVIHTPFVEVMVMRNTSESSACWGVPMEGARCRRKRDRSVARNTYNGPRHQRMAAIGTGLHGSSERR